MLQNTQNLYGHKLAALDGEIGQVKDFYFDDKTWIIRYIIADTGSWLTGRLVLLSPRSFGGWDKFDQTLHLKLTKKQIENSPSIESHKPVSRQNEIEYHRYYGWPAYWNGGAILGLGGSPVILPESKDEMEAHLHHHRDDKHLQSSKALTGFQVENANETIGRVSGFLVDDRSWAIHKLVVGTEHGHSGSEIHVTTSLVGHISYEDSKVFVKTTTSEIKRRSGGDGAGIDAGNQETEAVSSNVMAKTALKKGETSTAFSSSFKGPPP